LRISLTCSIALRVIGERLAIVQEAKFGIIDKRSVTMNPFSWYPLLINPPAAFLDFLDKNIYSANELDCPSKTDVPLILFANWTHACEELLRFTSTSNSVSWGKRQEADETDDSDRFRGFLYEDWNRAMVALKVFLDDRRVRKTEKANVEKEKAKGKKITTSSSTRRRRDPAQIPTYVTPEDFAFIIPEIDMEEDPDLLDPFPDVEDKDLTPEQRKQRRATRRRRLKGQHNLQEFLEFSRHIEDMMGKDGFTQLGIEGVSNKLSAQYCASTDFEKFLNKLEIGLAQSINPKNRRSVFNNKRPARPMLSQKEIDFLAAMWKKQVKYRFTTEDIDDMRKEMLKDFEDNDINKEIIAQMMEVAFLQAAQENDARTQAEMEEDQGIADKLDIDSKQKALGIGLLSQINANSAKLRNYQEACKELDIDPKKPTICKGKPGEWKPHQIQGKYSCLFLSHAFLSKIYLKSVPLSP
jgi:hypothetical protein